MTRSNLFIRNHPTLLLIKKGRLQMPLEIYYQKMLQHSQENTCVEVGLQLY